MSISLQQVVPFGRARWEYERMFALTPEDFQKRILGCADGPASFNAEMTADGSEVVSFDPIYVFSAEQISRRFEESVDQVIDQVRATPDDWIWTYHRSVDDLRRHRRGVLERFLADYEAGRKEGRYRVATLPELPFDDGAFELALCSHFLFLYSDLFSEEFHIQSTIELCRVAREVRVFPLLTLSHERSAHLGPVMDRLTATGVSCRVEKVDYELQKGGNQMLRLVKE